ncbi:hypothetical protein ACMFMG_012010 [Clarireedia jacksonii]
MAQRTHPAHQNSPWRNTFPETIFDIDPLTTPGEVPISPHDNTHNHFASTSSNLFPGQENPNYNDRPHLNPTIQNGRIEIDNETNSPIHVQSQQLFAYLVEAAAPTKKQMAEGIREDIQREMEEGNKRTLEQMEERIINKVGGEMKADIKKMEMQIVQIAEHMRKLGEYLKQQAQQQQGPYILTPYNAEADQRV